MGNQVELLVDIQTVDQQLRERTDAIAALRRRITELDAELEEQRRLLESCRAERAELDTRRRDFEGTLLAAESKTKDHRMRLNRIRNEKEASAVRREIEVTKEENSKVEEELLVCFEALEGTTAREAELQSGYEALETRRRDEAAQAESEIAALSAGLEDARHRRDELASAIDAPLRRQYETVFARRRGLAVVEVRGGSCQGCHMRVAPQLVNEIQRSRRVIACPSCHRILYWRPDAAESEA